MKRAVIDIGTNTLLLLIVDEQNRRVVDLCRFGRLGKGLDASGQLASDSIAKSLLICREYRDVMNEHGVGSPRIIGTQALREAANAADFLEPAERILGARIQVIDGAREAELAYLSVAYTFPAFAKTAYLVVDVGGGSTEVIVSDHNKMISAVSVPIGAVRLTERHLTNDPPTAEQLAALEADIDAQLAPLQLPYNVDVVGTAGTATTMTAVALQLVPYDSDKVTGHTLSAAEVQELYERTARATIAERRAMKGMEAQRADVIVAGIAIYVRIMRLINAPVLVACDRGIRWGLIFED